MEQSSDDWLGLEKCIEDLAEFAPKGCFLQEAMREHKRQLLNSVQRDQHTKKRFARAIEILRGKNKCIDPPGESSDAVESCVCFAAFVFTVVDGASRDINLMQKKTESMQTDFREMLASIVSRIDANHDTPSRATTASGEYAILAKARARLAACDADIKLEQGSAQALMAQEDFIVTTPYDMWHRSVRGGE